MLNKILCIVIIIFSSKIYAGAYVFPISVTSTSEGTAVIQKIISWDENDSPNPCYKSPQCWLGLDVLYSTLGTPDLGGTCRAGNCLEISGYATKRDVLEGFKKKFGVPYQSNPFIIDNTKATCVGMFYIKGHPRDGFGDGALWPESVCGKLPPINQSCEVTLPPSIDYGTVSSNVINGKRITIMGSVNCSRAGVVRLYSRSITGEENISMSNKKSLFAELTINNKRAWNGISIATQGNRIPETFSLTSTLRASGFVSAGAYEGTAIVLLSYP